MRLCASCSAKNFEAHVAQAMLRWWTAYSRCRQQIEPQLRLCSACPRMHAMDLESLPLIAHIKHQTNKLRAVMHCEGAAKRRTINDLASQQQALSVMSTRDRAQCNGLCRG